MTQTVTTDERIRRAAVELLGTQGYASTTMEQVRRRAQASNGSLYYFFPDKATLAARVFSDGMREMQRGVLGVVDRAPDAEAGVRGAVAWAMAWVDRNEVLARVVYDDLPDDVVLAASVRLDTPARDYVRSVTAWLRRQAEAGVIINRPFPVTHALWLGPSQEYCRHWLRGRVRARPTRVASDLADGAWKALLP